MEPKNVMLLGFVNKAVEYLDKHLDDNLNNSMTELKNIDLESLKKELGSELGASLGSMSSTIESLLNAGGEAFDTFMDRSKSESLSSEFDRMFDVDLDEEKPAEKKDELQDLLSYYHLDSAFEVDEKYLDEDEEVHQQEEVEEVVEEEVPEETPVEETSVEAETEKPVEEEATEEVLEEETEAEEEIVEEETTEESEEPVEEVPEEETIEEVVEEEVPEEITEETVEEVEETESDETAEVPEEETEVEEETTEVSKEAVEEVPEEESTFELTDEEAQMLQMIAQNVNKKPEDRQEDILSGANKELDSIFSELVAAEDELLNKKEEESETTETEETVEEEKIVEKPVIIAPSIDSDAFGYIENPLVDVAQPEEPEPEPDPNLVFPEQVEKDDIIQLIKDIQPLSDVYYNKIENFIDLQEREEKEEKKKEEKHDDRYVSSLIDDLKSKMSIEDERKKEAEEAYKLVYDKIHKTYPYLSNAFIRNVYEMKESIANEYPLGEKIIILHRTVFRNVENLRQYVEIALKHGYAINADEKKMIVDAFKQHVNTDGKVITSIFEVANQSALLNGEYEGYRVLFEDDL
ncbi:MAG: hypothetical protein IKS54_07100 [Erysipelotrichaceae bacterium]|nr:hypothetical protein [Erysipelotrichaceae bacterium]